jgi:DNA-binding CsgD family transcriptional regulator
MLRCRDGISLQSGAVVTADLTARRRLTRSIAEALGADGVAVRGADSILCPRPSGLRPYVIHVLPASHEEGRHRAVLVIIDPEDVPEPPVDVLRRLYGLTQTEARVAVCVLRGDGVKTIAEELAVSAATVKTHLQNVFSKTDTHRQAQLVRLLLSISR